MQLSEVTLSFKFISSLRYSILLPLLWMATQLSSPHLPELTLGEPYCSDPKRLSRSFLHKLYHPQIIHEATFWYSKVAANSYCFKQHLFSLQLHLNCVRLQGDSFVGGSDGKVSACNAGDPGLIPGSGRSSGEGNGNPLQYSCLSTLHGVAKSWTRLSDFTFTFTSNWKANA